MGTETLILRPCDITAPVAATAITHNPTGTDTRSQYLLVAEEVADDDASYVVMGGSDSIRIAFAIPKTYIGQMPSSMKIFFRQKADVDGIICDTWIATGYLVDNGDAYKFFSFENSRSSGNATALTTTEYNTFSINVPANVLSELDYSTKNTHFAVSFVNTVSSGKNKTAYTTQVYLEVTYSDDDTETTSDTIHLKENGTWTSIPCIIYQKQNNAWVQIDSTIFENGDRFTIQQLT